MRAWTECGGKRRGGATLVFGILLAGLLAGAAPSTAAADAAPPSQVQALPAGVAVVTVVRIRDLMSANDRQTYRTQVRAARDAEARQQIRREWLERLQARAAEHGVVVVVDTRGLRPDALRTEAQARPQPPRAP